MAEQDKAADRLQGFGGYEVPRYTPIPDALLDQHLDVLTGGELKVLLYIARHTLGYKKGADDLSARQIAEGITKRDGTVVDHGTGMSVRRVWSTLARLETLGLVMVRREVGEAGSERNVYALRMKDGGGDAGVTPLLTPESQGVVTPTSPPKNRLQEQTSNKQQQAALAVHPGEPVEEGTAVVVAPRFASTTDGDGNDLAARIAALGVHPTKIPDLLEAHAPDRVTAWVGELEVLGGNGRGPRNPAGLLVTALREGWEAPAGEQRKQGKAEGERRRLMIAVAEARVFLPDLERAQAAVDEQWPGMWPEVARELGLGEAVSN